LSPNVNECKALRGGSGVGRGGGGGGAGRPMWMEVVMDPQRVLQHRMARPL
jgi:hypothetical protein